MGTAVPQPTFGPSGFQAPSAPAVLTGVQADWNSALGGNVNPGLTTPQGQLASSETALIVDGNALFNAYVNYVDPAYSQGRMQDAIGRIVPGGGFSRLPAQPTVTDASGAVCSGAVGTYINTGAIAVDTNGNQYECTQAGTIGSDGTVALPFACKVNGPILLGANQLNTIYSTIPGWDSITNPDPGITGSNVETPQDFEYRRSASVAMNAVNCNQAIQGAVMSVTGVLDAYVVSNNSNSPTTIGGVSVNANSIFVCAAGGASQAVANAIWSKAPPGIPTQGSTAETVYDSNSGYELPYPTYTVNYQIATALGIYWIVQIKNSNLVPANALALIQGALQNAFTGADGGTRARIGSTLVAGRFYAGIVALGPWAQVLSITMASTITASSAVVSATISGTTLTVTGVTSGAVAAAQFLTGINVTSGTYVVAQLTGSPGADGTYSLSAASTVGSTETITMITANADQVDCNIEQIPAFVPANVQLVLV